MNLKDKKILITGATGGIGKSLVEKFNSFGSIITATGTNQEKLEIFIKHPKYDARPLEMGSGAEKTIASMAIRLAFLNVSSMPKPDLIVLDEPGTALDEENMQGFITILDI